WAGRFRGGASETGLAAVQVRLTAGAPRQGCRGCGLGRIMRVGGRTVAPRPNRMETLEKLRIARPLDARRAGLWAARAAVAAAFLVAMILDVRGERPPPRDRQPLPTFAGRSGRSHVDPRLSGVARALTARSVEVRCWSARDWRRRSGEFYANLRTA